MNISCISCPARYGVPDAKVRGKRVRITCKRCGQVLLVDGTVDPPRVASGAGVGPSVAPALSSHPPASTRPTPYTVAMPDESQTTADVAQIVRLYRDRVIDAQTLVWREGMPEWQSVWDVEEIAAAFRRMGYARPSAPAPSRPAQASYEDDPHEASTRIAPSSHPPAAHGFDDEEPTSVVDSSRLALEAEQALWAASHEHEDPTHVVPSPIAPPPYEPGEARVAATRQASERPARAYAEARVARGDARAESRQAARSRAQAPDLFASQLEIPDEREPAPAFDDDGAPLTGARSENSVLFSLEQLVRKEQQPHRAIVLPPRARTDESVLVDSSPSLPSGAAGSPLMAPDFTAPVSIPPPRAVPELGDLEYPRRRRSRAPLILVAVVLVAGGAAAGAWTTGKLQPLLAAIGVAKPAPEPAPESSAKPEPVAEEAPPVESAEPAAAEGSAEPEASAAPPASVAARATAPAKDVAAPPPTGVAEPAPPSEPKGTPAKSGGGKFDTAAAKEALTAAANKVSSCREATGPTGSGKVAIIFAPSGRPTSVAVTGDLAGTTVGSCVARVFRAARVPPFSGDPVSVSKSFSVR